MFSDFTILIILGYSHSILLKYLEKGSVCLSGFFYHRSRRSVAHLYLVFGRLLSLLFLTIVQGFFENSRCLKDRQNNPVSKCLSSDLGKLLHWATPSNSSPFLEIANFTSVSKYCVRVSMYFQEHQRNNGSWIQPLIEMPLTFELRFRMLRFYSGL